MGRAQKKRYTHEFKNQAVAVAKRIGVTRAAKELGLSKGNLQRWKSMDDKRNVKVPEIGESPDQQIRRLEKEVEELRKVNFILRKAAAFFSQDQLK